MKTFTLILCAVSGILALGAGIVALIVPHLVLSPDLRTPLTQHLIREEAAAFVFIGMMLIWCVRHFERRQPVHIGLVVFTGLFAVIHWLGYLEDGRISLSAIVNTVPFVIFVVTMPRVRAAAEQQGRPASIA
jgi:hypothetical protein